MLVKKSFSILIFLFTSCLLFAQKYRIADVEYELQKTKPSAVSRNIEISTTKIFDSFEDFHNYMDDVQKRFKNERIFEESLVTYRYEYEDFNTELQLVHVHIYATDSKSLLILPYPKYASGEGLSLKLKIKDANFLGTMSDLSADAYFAVKNDEDDEEITYKTIGFDFKYSYPFKAGIFDASWNNDYFVEYNLDKSQFEYNTKTGFTFELPFENYSFVFDMSESIIKDYEYEFYEDLFHFNTDFMLSMPIKVAEIGNWGNLLWTPYTDYSINYDKNGIDGINKENIDLSSPILTFGHKVGTKRINWEENFRDGLSLEFGQSVSYNFQRNEYNPKIYGEFIGFKSIKYFGISTRFYAMTNFNTREKIGGRLRGIIDEQKYKNSREKALKVSSAIVFNIDIPIHIITTDWNYWTESIFGEDSWIATHTKWFDTFNFEMQISPFIDIAWTKNAITNTVFSAKDGFYAGGIEVLVFPAKWRSVVVRGSYGIDIGRKFMKDYINLDWRKDISKSEIYIGIGLHY